MMLTTMHRTDSAAQATSEGASPVAISLVIPVYGNAGSIPELMRRVSELSRALEHDFEAIFVVDGSPDDSYRLLLDALPSQAFSSQLIAHSRNFGSFAAIRTGLKRARGTWFAMMAADLQEPAGLVLEFHRVLAQGDIDVVVGVRGNRDVDGRSSIASRIFWSTYRRFVQPEIPAGGVDMFGGNQRFLASLLALDESNSSLVGLVYWLGFRRETVTYDRLERSHGTSGWTFGKKLRYLSDSVFSFTDLPVRVLMSVGIFGIITCVAVGIFVVTARLAGIIRVPGYSATILVVAFFAALNLFGLGIIGAYVWRTFENTKQRPGAVVMSEHSFTGDPT